VSQAPRQRRYLRLRADTCGGQFCAWFFVFAARRRCLAENCQPAQRNQPSETSPMKEDPLPSNREIVTDTFAAWMNGTGYVTSIFADDMTWKITGRSVVSRKYASTRQFRDEVLRPFGDRFSAGDPFRPVVIRAVYDDEEYSTVIVVWDGRGTTTADTVYENTYAWIMTPRGGKVIDGTAFFDSIAFNELWEADVVTASSATSARPAAGLPSGSAA
jgi:hypothetical protein